MQLCHIVQMFAVERFQLITQITGTLTCAELRSKRVGKCDNVTTKSVLIGRAGSSDAS